MKYYLLSNYEGFCFTSTEESDKYAYTNEEHHITVINERNLFGTGIPSMKKFDKIEESKNLALPISFEFRHEKNSHQKRNNENPMDPSCSVFYMDGEYERIKEAKKGNNKKSFGSKESYRMLESYLIKDSKVFILLKSIHIFGELLNYEYYIEKDFKKFIQKLDEIKKKNKDYLDDVGFYNGLYCKKENNIKLQKKEMSDIYDIYNKKLKKEENIYIGDIEYSKEIFDKCLKKWEIMNSFKNK